MAEKMGMRIAACLLITTWLMGASPPAAAAESLPLAAVNWSDGITGAVGAAPPMAQVRSRTGGTARRKKVWIATASGALFAGIGWAVGNAMP